MMRRVSGGQKVCAPGFHLILILHSVLAFPACARTFQVVFAGGQSNAKAEWAAAIENVLKMKGGPDVLMVQQFHPGHWLQQWFTTTPQVDYTNDFFNAAGTGYLQSRLQALTARGDDYEFRGFFWFQGEGDTGNNADMDSYRDRFFAMLDHLRQDLGIDYDIRFTMAIIDLNPDPFYDEPTNAAGRSRADIEKMRAIQVSLASTNTGSYVDSRSYGRVDAWHLPSLELARLGVAMGQAYVAMFGVPWVTNEWQVMNGGFESGTNTVASAWNQEAFGSITIPSDISDGAVFERANSPGGGAFPMQDLIAGSAAGPANYSGIVLFALPSQSFGTGSLTLTVAGGGVLSNANIDVWGLGYVRGLPAMNPSWGWYGDADTRTGSALGIGGGSNAPIKIADNIVTRGVSVSAGTVWQNDADQGTTLVNFLNSLYANGARPGDYAVIRVNPDTNVAAVYDGTPGREFQSIRYGGSHRTAPDQRARLHLNFSSSQIIAERSVVTPRTGTNCFRFGLDRTHRGTNVAWITQDLFTGDISGRRVVLTGHSRHNSADPLLANQQVEFQFACTDFASNVLSLVDAVALNSASPLDAYQTNTLSGLAPAGTARVSIRVTFRAIDYLSQEAGSAFVDDLNLSISPSPEPELQFTHIRLVSDGELELRWATASNRHYVVQSAASPLGSAFADLTGILTATADELAITNLPTASAQFYRVRLLP